MKIRTAQKKIIVKLLIYFVIIGGMSAISIYLNSVGNKVKEKHDWLRNDISSLTRKIEGLSTKALELSEAISVWESFDDESSKLQGLRITKAKDVIDRLEKVYKISNLKVSFSKPDEIIDSESGLVTDSVSVVSSDVSIDISGVTDVMVFDFLGALEKGIPGYVEMQSLSVTRKDSVKKGDLERISKGDFPDLVDAKIKFLWRDLKYKGPASSDSAEKQQSEGAL